MSYFNLFEQEVEKGLNNEAVYIPLSQEKLNSNIFFGKSMYFLIGGLSGIKNFTPRCSSKIGLNGENLNR